MPNVGPVLFGVVMAFGCQARAAGVLELQGRGVQVYRCDAASGGAAWTLAGPDATLLTSSGAVAGHHFAGPTWQANDGSLVVGAPVASGTSPVAAGQTGSVPWLVLRAISHAGAGSFGAVTYVVRSRTVGGLAPSSGCDLAHLHGTARVAYSATYTLFGVR